MIYDDMICIPSSKHISVLVKKFEDMDGRPAKIYKTPGFDNLCCEELSPVLNEKDASEYRSVVGLVMYASHVRCDTAYQSKTLASFLSWKHTPIQTGRADPTPPQHVVCS